jgi:hypothetical protein
VPNCCPSGEERPGNRAPSPGTGRSAQPSEGAGKSSLGLRGSSGEGFRCKKRKEDHQSPRWAPTGSSMLPKPC